MDITNSKITKLKKMVTAAREEFDMAVYGDDNRGNKWMTIPPQWGDTTINRRNGQ